MFSLRVEIKKHVKFFVPATVILCLSLLAYANFSGQISDIMWVFAVILISFSTYAYSLYHIIVFSRGHDDTLLQLSNFPRFKKIYIKTLPLFIGTLIIGFLTITGYVLCTSDISTMKLANIFEAYSYIFFAKVFSILSCFTFTWFAIESLQKIRKETLAIFTLTIIFVIFIGIHIAFYWQKFSLSGNSDWFVGSTSDFLGLPVYINFLPIVFISVTPWKITTFMLLSLCVNIVVTLFSVCSLFVLSKKKTH